MKLEIGKRYLIECDDEDPSSAYHGPATLINLNHSQDPEGVYGFVCDDGVGGCFSIKQIIKELPRKYAVSQDIMDDVILALSIHKDSCSASSEAYNQLIQIQNS